MLEQVSAEQVFQVTGHGLEPWIPSLVRATQVSMACSSRSPLDGAADFFRLPLATKQRASRAPANVTGYTTTHADRFTLIHHSDLSRS